LLHTDMPTRRDVETIASHKGHPALTIYLATTPLTQETAADRTALRNLLRQAVTAMEGAGLGVRVSARSSRTWPT